MQNPGKEPQMPALPSNRAILRARVFTALTFAGLLLACAANIWVFRTMFDRSYIEWYSDAGPFIALATAVFGAAWGDLNKHSALISANPLHYFGACLQVAGLPLLAIGTHVQSHNRPRPVALEFVPLVILTLALLVGMLGWLLFVVPAQYFLFLVAGALSRIAMTSSARISARMQGTQVEFAVSPPAASPKPAEGWWDASMREQPITLTNAFGAVLLLLLGLLWE